jgi:DNA polymerase III subunit delta'
LSDTGFLKIIRGQDRASELLGRAYREGRLAHAYLFAGPSGVGRLTAALELAAAWMCSEEEHGYCGKCRDCTRVFNFRHPDVMLTIPATGSTSPEEITALMETRMEDGISPIRLEGNTRITIDQIRELADRISRKAFENKGHIEIILDADRMGTEAANALLKTLEEPPDETVLILISAKWSALLPTIRSRTHLVRFRRLGHDAISGILTSRLGLDADTADRMSLAADGRPGIALCRANSATEGTTEGLSASVLKQLQECKSLSGVLSLASETARKLGREGALEFCKEMQSLLHDVRRTGFGLEPISGIPAGAGPIEEADGTWDRCLGLFRTAEMRLAGNGMTGIVLAAAFTGSWEAINGGS